MTRSRSADVGPDDPVVLEVERERVRCRYGRGAGADLSADGDVVQAHPVDTGDPGVGPVDPASLLVDHHAVARVEIDARRRWLQPHRGSVTVAQEQLLVGA